MDVLGVHVAILEDQVAAHRFDPGAFEIGSPVVDDRRGAAVVESSADRRIAVSNDLHIAVERSRRVDVAASVDRGGHFEIRPEEINGSAGAKEFRVRRGSERQICVPLAHHLTGFDLHDLDARVGRARRRTIHQRGQAFLERVAGDDVGWSGGHRSPARLSSRTFLRRVGVGRMEEAEDDEEERSGKALRTSRGHR